MNDVTSSIRFTETKASALLDMVRALAAFSVLLVHWRNMLFVDFAQTASSHGSHLLSAVFYVVTSGGHQAVLIFFVLSGYLVGGSALRMFAQKRWFWSVYLAHRMVRLWTVLLPGLLLCFFWDKIGLFSHWPLYHGIIPNYVTGDILKTHTFSSFFGNLFFLQPMLTPIYGSDGPLWSLSYEFWYYIIFPLGLVALRREFSARTRLWSGLGFLVFAWFIRKPILSLFPVWMLGVLLAVLDPPKLGSWVRWTTAVLFVPLIFVFSHVQWMHPLALDYLFALLATLLIWTFLSARGRVNHASPVTRSVRRLARFSFTLYMVHQPFILIWAALLIGTKRWLPSALHVVVGGGILLLTLLYSYGVATLTEFQTDNVRQWIEQWLGLETHAGKPT